MKTEPASDLSSTNAHFHQAAQAASLISRRSAI